MKIELEIPDWTKGEHIYIFSNQELIAYSQYLIKKNPKREGYTPFKIKIQRCNGCGDCCESGSPFNDKDIPCPHLTTTGCGLGVNIPFSCARSDCSITFTKCSEMFE